MKIFSINRLRNLTGKKVFLRVDFNVALEKGKIREDFRLRAALPTIELLLQKGASLVIATHLGDPQGKVNPELSVRPLARRLQSLLGRPVHFIPEVTGAKVSRAIAALPKGGLLMIENLRFDERELTDDQVFARALAAGMDLYVNDAFSVSHRAQASVSAIKKELPSYAGLLIVAEVTALARIAKPQKPLVVVMGGSKIATKAPLIRRLHPCASSILVAGALANNFFRREGLAIGSSLFDADSDRYLDSFYRSGRRSSKIVLPLDIVVKTVSGQADCRRPGDVKKGESILDVGPKTIALFDSYIKQAKTIVWNGPLGKFEEASFRTGTLSVARSLASRASGQAYGLIGGGETVAALKLTKMEEYVDWVSTAGGAMLAYLGGEKLPGLKGLVS